MKKLIFIVFLFPWLLIGQNEAMDSLKIALKNAKHDTTRVKLLQGLSGNCEVEDIMLYAEPCIKISESNLLKAQTPRAKYVYLNCLSSAYSDVGYLATMKADIKKAIDYYDKCLKIKEQIKDKIGVASALGNLANIYDNQGGKKNALEYYLRSLAIYEEINDKGGIIVSLNNIGSLYLNRRDFKKTFEYYERCLKMQEEIKDVHGSAATLNNIGAAYRFQHNDDKAIEYTLKALKIEEKFGDKLTISMALSNIAYSMINKGMLNEALTNAKGSFKLAQELKYPTNIFNAAGLLSIIYHKQNNYKDALEMRELEIKMRDSLRNEGTKNAALKNLMKYQFEKKEAVAKAEHNAELLKQRAIAEEKNHRQNIVIGSVTIGLLFVIVFAGFVFRSLRITHQQKILIEIKNRETEQQKLIIEEKQKEVLDSIHYAKRIQNALITSEIYIDKTLKKLMK